MKIHCTLYFLVIILKIKIASVLFSMLLKVYYILHYRKNHESRKYRKFICVQAYLRRNGSYSISENSKIRYFYISG